MKKIIAFLFLTSAMCVSAFAQSRIPEFDKAKQIKMLESTREDVKKILKGFESDDKDAELFNTKNAEVEIYYSTGECSDEEDSERWNVPEGKVSFVRIWLKEPIKLENIGFDYSDFQKENKYDFEDQFIYRSKTLGIAFEVDENKVERFFLFPPITKFPLLCSNETAKEFYLSENWSDDSALKSSVDPNCVNIPGKVDNLILSADEIISCNGKNCPKSENKISVTTEASDPENDVLIYDYKISGGKIIGKGAKIIWDLSDVQPGTYTITASVDDGCGFCGESKTKEIVVK